MSSMTRANRKGGVSPLDAASATGESPATSLESFVAQLHTEGVEAGRKEAERLVRRAEEEAAEILRRARVEAEEVLAEARRGVADEQARGRAELELAIRDAVLGLKAALADVLRSILARGAEAHLTDPDLLASLLKEVVGAYARADAAGRPTQVRVPRKLAEALESWWLRELATALDGSGATPEFSATLEEAGFEYRVADGIVEVSVESAVETLMALVRPGLRELVSQSVVRATTRSAEAPLVPAGTAGASGRRTG